MLLKEISISNLEKRYKQEKDSRLKQRLHILLLLREGWTEREVARMVHAANGKVHFWKNRFESKGFEGLADKNGRGLKPKLTEEEMSMLASAIDDGVLMDDGYRRGFKTKDVSEFINVYFSITYTLRHCRRILQSIDCSLQVPRPRGKSRNQEDVDEFKKEFKKNEKVWVISS